MKWMFYLDYTLSQCKKVKFEEPDFVKKKTVVVLILFTFSGKLIYEVSRKKIKNKDKISTQGSKN